MNMPQTGLSVRLSIQTLFFQYWLPPSERQWQTSSARMRMANMLSRKAYWSFHFILMQSMINLIRLMHYFHLESTNLSLTLLQSHMNHPDQEDT